MSKSVFDSVNLGFFKRQLEHILTKVFQTPYPAKSARSMFPVSEEGGAATSITYYIWDDRGIAEFISSYAGDIPRADVSARSVTIPVHRMAESFGMTLDEIKAAQQSGTNLSAKKADAVRKGHEDKLNEVAFYGAPEYSLQGLFSHPSIPNGEAPYLDWDDEVSPKTADEILACFREGIKAIGTATNYVETVTAIRVPNSIYWHLGLIRMTDSNETVLSWLKTKLAAMGVREVEPYQEGETVTMLAGETITSNRVIVYYDNSNDALELMIPEDLNFLPPQEKGLEQETIGTLKTGGLVVYKPLSIFLQYIDDTEA